MKKIYMKPEMAIENVVVEQTIMAGSTKWDDNNNTGSSSKSDEVATGDGLGNSGFNLWDDED